MDRDTVMSLVTIGLPPMDDVWQGSSSESMDSDAPPATRRQVSEQRSRLRVIRSMGEAALPHCRECELQFRNPSRLVSHHVYKHQSPGATERGKKVPCPICQQRCKSRRTMTAHLGTHLGERLCKKCGAEFASAGTAAAHKRFHRTAGNFICEECEKLFARQSDLNSHHWIEHAQPY
ncbi:zinc finger protein ZFPM1-like [Amblyomma americanum]|uniref:C2H2-type domain-containing protein n=1 Tax=Amblyomma americanum TaxID=6943 RepID=A0AAQ4ECI3_AMBAM